MHTHGYFDLVVVVVEAVFTWLMVKEQTHDSKYIIHMYGRKFTDSYSYRNLHIVTSFPQKKKTNKQNKIESVLLYANGS